MKTAESNKNTSGLQKKGNAKAKNSFFGSAAPAPFFQPKLTVNKPGDAYEAEADAVAETIMRMPAPDLKISKPTAPIVTRKCGECEREEKELQRKENTGIEPVTEKIFSERVEPPSVIRRKEDDELKEEQTVVQRKCRHCEEEEKKISRKEGGGSNILDISRVEQTLNSHGQPLNDNVREFMEHRLGYDFSGVHIHNDSLAHQSSSDINALAYTHQNHIVFGSGQYQPESDSGKRLLAHELTHVIQQGNSIQPKTVSASGGAGIQRKCDQCAAEEQEIRRSENHLRLQRTTLPSVVQKSNGPPVNIIQRFTPGKTPDLIFENPGASISENVFYLDYTAPREVSRLGVMSSGKLEVFSIDDKAKQKSLGSYSLKKTIAPPPFLYVLEMSGFYVYGYSYKEEKHVFVGKKSSGLSEEAKKVFADWDAVMTIANWFEKADDYDHFLKNHIYGQFFGLWVQDASSSTSSVEKEQETVPPQPEWMSAWEKAMKKLIRQTRDKDAVSTDIPDVFKFYYSKSKLRWRASANMMYENKKVEVYLDINENDSQQQKLTLIRDKIRIKQLTPDEPTIKSKDAKELEEELTWAYRIKLELDKLIVEERVKYPSSADLPDRTAIVTLEDQAGKAFLKLNVYVVQALPENKAVPEVKATSILKTGILPQPLEKNTPLDQLLGVVKKATLALRGQTFKPVSSEPKKADKILEPFPAAISVIAGRDDFKTVTGASLDMHMGLNLSVIEGNNQVHQVSIAYRGIYYTWDIYRVNDILTDEEKKSLDTDWIKRRGQLINLFKDSGRMKSVNPVINEEKLKELNETLKIVGQEMDASKTLTPEQLRELRNEEISYGSATKLTPDATLTLPGKDDEYVIYCRAVTEPYDNVFRLPSEAFYPIKVLDGYELAVESRDANLEEINDLTKQVAATEDEKKKEELTKRIGDIRAREKMPLDKRTASDLNEVARTKRLANRLITLYNQNLGKKISLTGSIIKEPADDVNDLFQLWFTIETTDPGKSQVEKLRTMISQLDTQAKGLRQLQSNISDFAGDMATYKDAMYTPVTALVSKVTGEVYNLITMLAVKTTANGGTEVILVDVTAHQTQGKYYGSSAKAKDAGGLDEAVQNAYYKFGEECKYGEGYIAFRVPGANIFGRALSKPGFKQKVLEYLGYIAMAAGIAALVLGTIATGGALGVAAFALGVGAGVIGAGLAIHNIYDRAVNHRLEADVELIMDILNIIGPVLMGLSALSKVAKLSQAAKLGQAVKAGTVVEESAETIASVAKLHRLVQIHRAFAILQKAEAVTNLSLVGYKTFKDLAAISEAYAKDPKKRAAMEWEVLKNAALAGTIALVALRNEFKPTSASMGEMEQLVNSGYKERNYIELMKKSGLFNSEGKWIDPTLKSIDEGSSTQKETIEGKPVEDVKPTDVKPADSEVKPAEPEVKPTEPEVKPTEKESAPVKPVDEVPGTTPKKEPADTSPETVPEVTPLPQTEATAAKTKKLKKPKEKFPTLVIDKPVTLADGSTATLKADGSVVIQSKIGKGTGRKAFEKRMLSGIKVGLKGWHRAHSQGQGTGSESPYGILYAPPEVNLAYQNSGIEARIREIFRITPPEFELTLTTVTKAHPAADGKPSKRLASIEYRIEISEPGQPRKYIVLEAGLKVQDVVTNPKVEASAESFAADALWSIRYGEGTTLGMSAQRFEALKKASRQVEKQLNELIERLEMKLRTSQGQQRKIDQFHLDRFKELRDSLYEHPDMIPTIRAEMDEAAMWYPKEPLISSDAQTYLNQWRGKINQGSKDHIKRLLELSGSWKDLIKKLQTDAKANKTTLKILERFRYNVVTRLKKTFNADTLPGSGTHPESDVDLNLKGSDAGANLIKAEAQMKEEFGDNWSKLLRLNFYTEGERLLRYTTAKMSPDELKAFEKELTKKTMQYSLAKMLQHAKNTPDGSQRVNKLIEAVAPQEAATIKSMSDLDAATMLKKRDQLHAEVDALQKELSQLSPDDPSRIEKSKQVTLKQMEINFYSIESYIGPASLMGEGAVAGSPLLKVQKVFSNLEMMEHIIRESNGNIIRAMKEYELYKYMYRISEAVGARQTDLFFDYLNQQIYKVNRQGAESMTPTQLQNLYYDFIKMVNTYLGNEIKTVF